MKDFSTSFLKPAIPFFLLLILIWLIHFFNTGYDLELHTFGIFPRKTSGLIGILLSPLIHSSSDIKHIINNSPPVIILGWALLYFYKEIAFKIFCYSWFLVGFFVWISGFFIIPWIFNLLQKSAWRAILANYGFNSLSSSHAETQASK